MTPFQTRELFEAGQERRLEKLFTLQKGFHDLSVDLFGHLRGENRIDGAFDKMIVRLGGLEEMPIRLLSPYQGFSEGQYLECERILLEKYSEWVRKE